MRILENLGNLNIKSDQIDEEVKTIIEVTNQLNFPGSSTD